MADYEARIAPFINVTFYVTSEWWEEPRNHRGLDIATPTAVGNFPISSMCDGTVIFSGAQTDGQGNYTGYGNYIIVEDSTTHMGFLFAHLDRRDVAVGDQVAIGEQIGLERNYWRFYRNSPSFRNARLNKSQLDIWSTKRSLYKSCNIYGYTKRGRDFSYILWNTSSAYTNYRRKKFSMGIIC